MTTYRKLKKEFDEKVEKLQSECPHKNLSGWVELHWAPGHSTGTYCRVCNQCNLTIHKEYIARRCTKCGVLNPLYNLSCQECESYLLEKVKILERLGVIKKEEKIKNDTKQK